MTTPTVRSHRPHKDGEQTREKIRAAIRLRHDSGQPWPILAEIVAETKLPKGTVRHQVDWMAEHGDIQVREATREVTRQELVLVEQAPQS